MDAVDFPPAVRARAGLWPRSRSIGARHWGTVLANEEIVDGKSEVGGFDVIRKPMRQMVLKITAYAERLLEDLSPLKWPTSTLEMQRTGSSVPSVPRSISRLLMCRAICASLPPAPIRFRRYLYGSGSRASPGRCGDDRLRSARAKDHRETAAQKRRSQRQKLERSRRRVFTAAMPSTRQ